MQHLTITNREGHDLAANLHPSHIPNSDTYAIFAHCFTCGKNIKAAVNIANQLAAMGINVLRFDFTGIGASAGDIKDAYFTNNINDLIDAANYLEENYKAPSLMIGHSLGGTATIAAAYDIKSVKAVATIGAPAHSGHILETLGVDQDIIDNEGQHDIKFYGNNLTVNKQFVDDVCFKHLQEKLNKLKKSLLIMHSPVDEIVSIDHAGELFQMAQHPKSFISLNKAEHLLGTKKDAKYVASLISQWAKPYLPTITEITYPKPVSGGAVGTLNMSDTYLTRLSMNEHQLIADEPTDLGGSNLGPTPMQLLEASLVACTTITLSMYTTRKKWAVDKMDVTVKRQKIDGKTHFIREITVVGDLTEEQRGRILEIANKCPVHKLIANGSPVDSYLV